MPVVAFGKRKSLEEGGVNPAISQTLWNTRSVADKRKDLGTREERSDALGYTFAAAPRDEPMMNDRYTHRLTLP
jgi:hypothetical protein